MPKKLFDLIECISSSAWRLSIIQRAPKTKDKDYRLWMGLWSSNPPVGLVLLILQVWYLSARWSIRTLQDICFEWIAFDMWGWMNGFDNKTKIDNKRANLSFAVVMRHVWILYTNRGIERRWSVRGVSSSLLSSAVPIIYRFCVPKFYRSAIINPK